MVGLLLIVTLAGVAAWFAWVYGVSPAKDRKRIVDSYGGTDASVVKIERVGTQLDDGALTWTGDWPGVSRGRWYRIYAVTLRRPGGTEEKTVGVEVRFFGLPVLKTFELEA